MIHSFIVLFLPFFPDCDFSWVQIKISLSSHQDFFSTSIDTSSVPSCWAQNSWNFRSSIDPNFWDQPDLVEWKTLSPTVLHQPAIWHIQPLSHWEQGIFHGSDVKRLDIADDFQIATVLTGRYHWGGARLRRFDLRLVKNSALDSAFRVQMVAKSMDIK